MTSSQLHGPGLSPVKETQACLTSAALYLLSTKRRPEPQLGQQPRYLGRMIFTILTDKVVFLAMINLFLYHLSALNQLGKNQFYHLAQTDGSACDELQGLLSGNLDTLPYSLQNEPSSPPNSLILNRTAGGKAPLFSKNRLRAFSKFPLPFDKPAIRVARLHSQEEVQ